MTNDPRALLTALHHAAVQGAEPFTRTKRAVADWLGLQRKSFASNANVHVFGLGKASVSMTLGAVDALHDAGFDPQHGVIVCAASDSRTASLPREFVVVQGNHPVPGPASLNAADAIDGAITVVQPGDVVIVLLSGGTTSLAAAPVAALSLAIGDVDRAQAHLANLADTLLESGIAIHEMNAIRRRLLRFGAGRLAVALHHRGATHIPVFAISDVIGDEPAVIGSGPCTADPLDEPSFLALFDAHDLRHTLEAETALFLGAAGAGRPPAVPLATHPAFAAVEYQIVARNGDALDALATAARNAGVTYVIGDLPMLESEAASLGDRLARFAVTRARLLAPEESALLVLGGEPVVNLRTTYARAYDAMEPDDNPGDDTYNDPIPPSALEQLIGAYEATRRPDSTPEFLGDRPRPETDEPMRGGRMQVLALSAAFALEELAASGEQAAWRVTVLAAGTDGRDGPTDAAGAIVDAAMPALARRAGRRPERDLNTGRSWFPLDAADALVRTGPTGTNVMDVVAILISPARSSDRAFTHR